MFFAFAFLSLNVTYWSIYSICFYLFIDDYRLFECFLLFAVLLKADEQLQITVSPFLFSIHTSFAPKMELLSMPVTSWDGFQKSLELTISYLPNIS
jgi:hypothetical protein